MVWLKYRIVQNKLCIKRSFVNKKEERLVSYLSIYICVCFVFIFFVLC